MSRTNIILLAGIIIGFNILVGLYLFLAPTPDALPEGYSDIEVAEEADEVSVPVFSFGTALDAMELHASTSDFSYEGEEYPGLGIFVHTVNGRKNTEDKFWILYHNGTTSPVGAGDLEVSPGDSLEWRFEESIY